MHSEYVSNEELIQAARRRLSDSAWAYLVGGSESETTLRRNRHAFDRIAFRPRVLVDVSTVDPSTTFLGQRLRIPALLAPLGSLHLFDPQGAAASVKAAAEFGIMPAVSSATEPSIEVCGAAALDQPKIFQLYVLGDMDWTADVLRRVRESGYSALAVTVDVAHYSRRERAMLSRHRTPTRTSIVNNDRSFLYSLTWEKVARIRDMAGLPFMLKGIQTAEDAELAVQYGVEYIWVSNHGGRQLDHGRGSLDTLPEIVQAVAGRARIIVDGGVQRGSDILKALALGADVVALGRLQGWALAANGQAGVVRMLEIVEDELVCAMGLVGLPSLRELTPKYICPAEAVTAPHEMSSWVNMPFGRIV